MSFYRMLGRGLARGWMRDRMADPGVETQRRVKPKIKLFSTRTLWGIALLFIVLSSIYWALVASDRYVSEAHVYLKKSNSITQSSSDIISMIAGTGTNHDLLLLRDHLLSVDMMSKLDAELHLRQHYSDSSHDLISRLGSADISEERFHRYYQSMVDVTYDDYSQVLVITAQAYSPKVAQALAQRLVVEGEQYMNLLDHESGQEQVRYIESQVTGLNKRVAEAHRALLSFQNQHGLVSPEQTAESVSMIASRLDAERADLQAKRRLMEGYLTPSAPEMVQIDGHISAIQTQLDAERKRLAAGQGTALNTLVEEQGRLQAEASFADDLYKTALVALESARVDSTRKINTVAILQSANLPQEPLQPRRIYDIILSTLGALMVAGVLHLITSIVRDHKD